MRKKSKRQIISMDRETGRVLIWVMAFVLAIGAIIYSYHVICFYPELAEYRATKKQIASARVDTFLHVCWKAKVVMPDPRTDYNIRSIELEELGGERRHVFVAPEIKHTTWPQWKNIRQGQIITFKRVEPKGDPADFINHFEPVNTTD